MIKIAHFALALSIVLTSCSSNENDLQNNNREQLLKSYTLKRDANGAYSIDFKTTNNTTVTTATNIDNSNEIILSEANHTTLSKHSNDFAIENNQLKIGLSETDKGKRTQISVEDENIIFTKRGVTEFLNSYSIEKNENGTFLLNFKVNDNVTSEFIYNEDIETYEVHLANGKSKQKNFSRVINVFSENNLLKIDFVNHKKTSSRRLLTGEYAGRKPRLIFEAI